MKKHCKECPHVIRNRHNDMIVDFSKRMNKSHNCHMIKSGSNNLWSVIDRKIECYGSYLMDLKENKDI